MAFYAYKKSVAAILAVCCWAVGLQASTIEPQLTTQLIENGTQAFIA